jgi:hypothetical protein
LPCSGRPATAVSSEMLQCGDATICKDWCITTQQQTLSHLISKRSFSHIIRDLGYSKVCTGWIPGSLTIEHKTERKAIFSSCGHVLKVREIASHPGLLQQMKPGSIISNQRLKDNAWNSTIFNLPGRGGGGIKIKKKSKFLREQDSHGYCLPGLWKRQLWCLHQDSDRTHKAFQTTASQDCDTLGTPSQNLVRHCYPIHLTAPSSMLRFQLIGALKNAICATKCETLDDVVPTLKTSLCEQNKAWNWQVIRSLNPRWRKAVKVDRGFVLK